VNRGRGNARRPPPGQEGCWLEAFSPLGVGRKYLVVSTPEDYRSQFDAALQRGAWGSREEFIDLEQWGRCAL